MVKQNQNKLMILLIYLLNKKNKIMEILNIYMNNKMNQNY